MDRLKSASAEGATVRFAGGRTKFDWGGPAPADVEISTLDLNEIREHNVGDLTAVLEAGVKLADAQAAFAAEGQMLALDPPDLGATIGGVIATADSGPLRHRYGSVRDLVVGMTVALSDGTVAKSGGKVIKNVAGYDLAKLFTGAYGTLGAILQVAVRLHPVAPATVTAVGRERRPARRGRRGLGADPRPAGAGVPGRALGGRRRHGAGPLGRRGGRRGRRARLGAAGCRGIGVLGRGRRRGPVGRPARRATVR